VERTADHVEVEAAGLEPQTELGGLTYSAPSEDGDAEVSIEEPVDRNPKDNGKGSSFFRS
ncbi:MAG: hypothetical protein WCO24_01355, partial [Actinomycetes bacterium]